MSNVKHWRVAAVACATLLVAPPMGIGQERRCTIVTNGSWEIYLHELAHCNGWVHPLFAQDLIPPPQYVKDFDGQLVIITSRRPADEVTQYDAAPGTKFIVSRQSVPDICRKLWIEDGINVSAYTDEIDKIVGCSVK